VSLFSLRYLVLRREGGRVDEKPQLRKYVLQD